MSHREITLATEAHEKRMQEQLGALKEFSERGINLEKIESRPRVGKPWEYIFFVEIAGHIKDKVIAEALEALKDHTLYLKHLGSYPRA